MFKTSGYAITTHLDRHNERVQLETLEHVRRQITKEYITSGIEHDIRIPPVGRIISGKVVDLDDGESALEIVQEIWEEGDSLVALQGDGRSIRIQDQPESTFTVTVDRSFDNEDGRELVKDLMDIAGPQAKPQMQSKKAVEPVSTLIIYAGVFVVGAIATGFVNKLGQEMFTALKTRLSEHYPDSTGEAILDFLFVAETKDHRLEVHVTITNPNPTLVSGAMDNRYGQLDSLVTHVLGTYPDGVRVVSQWDHGQLRLLYAVRRDGVPITPAMLPNYSEPSVA